MKFFNCIFLDIETIPSQAADNYEVIKSGIKVPGNYKKPESIEKWFQENGEENIQNEISKQALDPFVGEICSVAFAVNEASPVGVLRAPSEDEKAFMVRVDEAFREELSITDQICGKKITVLNDAVMPVGHNILFDLSFLRAKYLKHGLKPLKFMPSDITQRGTSIDTMRLYAGFERVSLNKLAKSLGLEGKLDIEIKTAFAENPEKLLEYNVHDVTLTRKIFYIHESAFSDHEK